MGERTLGKSGFTRTATVPGAATQRRAMVRGFGLLISQTVLMCVLIAGTYFSLPWLKLAFDKPIQRIQVHGEWKVLTEKNIAEVVVIYQTDTFLSIDLDRLVKQLETQPWIARARARREWPNTVSLDIVEQVPIAYWGDREMVSAKGRIFEHHGLYQGQPLPHLWSAVATPAETMSYYQIFERQLQAVNLQLRGISQNLQGDWELMLDNGLRVLLDRSDPAGSIRYFASIYQQVVLPAQQQALVVDMRYRHGAAIKWQQVAAVADQDKSNDSNGGEKI